METTTRAPAPGVEGSAPVIEARSLHKKFEIYLNDRSRFFEFFGRRSHHHDHWALQDVSFKVERGRSFGVVGPNGAGKSTLLKIMAGISQPTRGALEVRAPMSTLLDLGLGFHQHFTGRENIALNCSLLGMSRDQAEDRIPLIIAFAELDAFIDYPVRTYSSGMMLRLGFAIAAHTDSEVFLVDEVLAVGDQYFQRKCINKIEEFVESGRTIILVSHDLHAVRSLCEEVLWLDGGRVQAVGPAREVVDRYMGIERVRIARGAAPRGEVVGATALADPGEPPDHDHDHDEPKLAPYRLAPSPRRPAPGGPGQVRPVTVLPTRAVRYSSTLDDPELQRVMLGACATPDAAGAWEEADSEGPLETWSGDRPVVIGSGEIRVLEVRILDDLGRPRERFRTGERLVVAVTFRTTEPVERPVFGAAIFRDDGVYVHGPNTRFDGVLDGTWHGVYTYFIVFDDLPLLSGSYRVSVAVFDKAHLKPHVWHNQLYEFEVLQDLEDHGMVRLDHDWGMITHFEPKQ